MAQRRRNLLIEWSLGLIIPLLVAGPICKRRIRVYSLMFTCPKDYVNENSRFQVLEGTGCGDAAPVSILNILVLQSWAVTAPLLSITVYYRRSHMIAESSQSHAD